MRSLVTQLHQGWRLLSAALSEIFDEAAYGRFLKRGQRESSRAAYSDFLRESAEAKARRPKCC